MGNHPLLRRLPQLGLLALISALFLTTSHEAPAGTPSAPELASAGDSPLSAAIASDTKPTFEAARALLGEGKHDEAVDLGMRALAYQPFSIDGYQLLYDISADRGDEAGQLRWGKWLYWSHHYSGRAAKAAAVGEQLNGLWEGWNRDQEILDRWREEIEEAVKTISGAPKQYGLAGHLHSKLMDLNPGDPKLVKAFDGLIKKAGTSVTGGAFTVAKVARRSPKWIASMNRRHQAWDDAFTRKTRNYEITTNVSYPFFETVSQVMEDMNGFYREIYGYKKRAPRLKLAIHRKRSDFDRFAIDTLQQSLPLGVLGWFWDRKLIVAAYDLSGDASDLSDLWNTLFHEASHHFTHLMTEKAKKDPPTWINEGTASFFEGCELKPDGSIVKNKPATLRTREWLSIDGGRRRHTLTDLITCPHRNYDGSYYSYGWALVYFLLNYEENDPRLNPPAFTESEEEPTKEEKRRWVIPAGRLVYRDAYEKYYKSYTKKGGDDPLTRAKRMFVEEIDDPEIPNWAAFEERWHKFTKKVCLDEQAGPSVADILQARARGYVQAGDFERALVTAELANDKRPNDYDTYWLIAEAYNGIGRSADAVFWMVRAWERAWELGDDWLLEVDAAEEWLKKNGGNGALEIYIEANKVAMEEIQELMETAVNEGHPVMAMLFAAHAMQAFGLEQANLAAAIDEMAELSGHDLRLWIAPYYEKTPEDNIQLGGTDSVRFDPDGVLINCPEKVRWRYIRSSVPSLYNIKPPFESRGIVQIDGRHGAFYLMGIGLEGRPSSGVLFRNGAEARFTHFDVTSDLDVEGSTGGRSRIVFNYDAALPMPPAQKLRFHLDVDSEGDGMLTVNEKHKRPIPEEWDLGRFTGGVAVGSVDGTVSLFSDVQVRPGNPFWPVPRSDD